jgi:hypothetical protein
MISRSIVTGIADRSLYEQTRGDDPDINSICVLAEFDMLPGLKEADKLRGMLPSLRLQERRGGGDLQASEVRHAPHGVVMAGK